MILIDLNIDALIECKIGSKAHFFEHMTFDEKVSYKLNTSEKHWRCSKCNLITKNSTIDG